MDKMNNQKKLCDEAVKLIREFANEASFLDQRQLQHIKSTPKGNTIILENTYGIDIEYSLSELSYLFKDKLQNFWPCGDNFFHSLDFRKTNVIEQYKNFDKLEFIEYIGNLNYTELRCKEIYKRLQDIEKETLIL